MTVDLQAPATEVAPLLLGAVLHGRGVSIRLTEVEAYLGESDPGSHAFRGQTPRTTVMFGPPGRLYAYFTYGMHVCANVVVGEEGVATAVLLRAGEVIDGLSTARARRTTSKRDADLASGPARLCVALGITLADNGVDLVLDDVGPGGSAAGALRLETSHTPVPPSTIRSGPRVGVSGPGGTSDFPWRYWVDGDPTVSAYRSSVARARPPRP